MATLVGNGQVLLENGQTVTPKNGDWVDGQHYFNGTLSQKGQESPLSGTPTAGQMVSKATVDQTNLKNWNYLHPGDVTGAGGVTPGTAGPATLNLQSVYDSAYNTPEIKAAQAEYDAKTKARDAALANEADNPFYAQGTLTGKQAKINDAAGNDLTRLQNQLSQLKSDAAIKVNIATKQYDINNQAYKDNLSMFNSLISSGGLTNATTADLANYATSTGIPVSMLQGILDKQKAEAIKGNALTTDIITQTDDKGNVTVAVINSKTGTVIAKNNLGQIGKSTTTAQVVPFSKLSATQQSEINKIKDAIRTKLATREEMANQFPEYAPYF